MKTWWRNLTEWPYLNRLMCNFLRRRGWVVFYLEEQNRICNGDHCWMKLYRDELKRNKT